MTLLLGNESDMAEWIGEALAVPGEADPDLRTIAEALHVMTQRHGAARTRRARRARP